MQPLNHIGGHNPTSPGAVSAQLDINKDGWWICHGSSNHGSGDWDFAFATSGEATQQMEYCRDVTLEWTTPDECIPHNTVRTAPSGQSYKLTSAMCAGEPIRSAFTSSFYGPFVKYHNKGPMANNRHSNAEQYFDGGCAATVKGLDAAKERCRQEKYCGGFHQALSDEATDEYCVNLGSKRAYPSDSTPQIGHWGSTFEVGSCRRPLLFLCCSCSPHPLPFHPRLPPATSAFAD